MFITVWWLSYDHIYQFEFIIVCLYILYFCSVYSAIRLWLHAGTASPNTFWHYYSDFLLYIWGSTNLTSTLIIWMSLMPGTIGLNFTLVLGVIIGTSSYTKHKIWTSSSAKTCIWLPLTSTFNDRDFLLYQT